jgi:dipeptidase E
VRLYLSSFRLGEHPELLLRLAGEEARVAVIANAMDDAPPDVRRKAVERELRALSELGLRPAELDLRSYFDDAALLRSDLAQYGAVWVRGGNVFMLRYALYRTGGDTTVAGALKRDALVYAGYSAGPCVLAPSLRGLEAVDDADAVPRIYGASPTWTGLGVLDFSIVPHYGSPDHPENAACERVAGRYRAAGIPHRTLRDGEALVIDGDDIVITESAGT